nr:mitochondrial distribution and morphology protein 38 [Quercus suber]
MVDLVQADSFATLGIFAYLGKSTRLFLSRMGIKDLDEHVKDFLSYLECGSLFIYPELSSISVYQLFMEVVVDEIGWLDFYTAFFYVCNQERRRSKQYPIQAEKEIILTTVFTVRYDVFFGFAHFSRSTLLPIDTNLLEFLLRSQSLLTVCLEDYWVAYDKPCSEPLKFSETGSSDAASFLQSRETIKLSAVLEAQRNLNDLRARGCTKNDTQHGSKLKKLDTISAGCVEGACAAKSIPQHESLIRKYSIKLASTSSERDIWMGTQLLFTDIRVAAELLVNQLHGYQVAERERKKLKRTLNDISSLIPVTILMLLSVSAIGHAAILAAIKKYIPFLIPSPYSSERLDVVKQLKRTKKMEVQSWRNLKDPSSRIP